MVPTGCDDEYDDRVQNLSEKQGGVYALEKECNSIPTPANTV